MTKNISQCWDHCCDTNDEWHSKTWRADGQGIWH